MGLPNEILLVFLHGILNYIGPTEGNISRIYILHCYIEKFGEGNCLCIAPPALPSGTTSMSTTTLLLTGVYTPPSAVYVTRIDLFIPPLMTLLIVVTL